MKSMNFSPIEWAQGKVRIIDQTLLPVQEKYRYLKTVEEVYYAIKSLQIRGAPAIGVAGAMGSVLGIWSFGVTRRRGRNISAVTFSEFMDKLNKVNARLASSRPTAENLFWALDRIKRCAEKNKDLNIPDLKKVLLKEALKVQEEDDRLCHSIGRHGAQLINSGDTILTHCNAGGLATSGFGTALGVVYTAKNNGKKIKVYATETRPLLQGARLTTWELMHSGVDVTLISDTMAGKVMSEGKIAKVIVGADRIASNGDTANKIGTYQIAVLAAYHGIPFYIAAPSSTFDLRLKQGSEIPIEERNPDEVRQVFGKRTAPRDVKVYNPAFDVTPSELITGIICEKGVLYPPYKKSIKRHLG
jgi:methylthioribose-1-phosphate isomerase